MVTLIRKKQTSEENSMSNNSMDFLIYFYFKNNLNHVNSNFYTEIITIMLHSSRESSQELVHLPKSEWIIKVYEIFLNIKILNCRHMKLINLTIRKYLTNSKQECKSQLPTLFIFMTQNMHTSYLSTSDSLKLYQIDQAR